MRVLVEAEVRERLEKLYEYAEWAGPDSIYRWALDTILAHRKVVARQEEALRNIAVLITERRDIGSYSRVAHGSLQDAVALARAAVAASEAEETPQ